MTHLLEVKAVPTASLQRLHGADTAAQGAVCRLLTGTGLNLPRAQKKRITLLIVIKQMFTLKDKKIFPRKCVNLIFPVHVMCKSIVRISTKPPAFWPFSQIRFKKNKTKTTTQIRLFKPKKKTNTKNANKKTCRLLETYLKKMIIR